jgi:hypothetical protein
MLVRLRRFGVVRTSNVMAVLYFLITLIVFVPFVIIGAIAAPQPGTSLGPGQPVVAFDSRPLLIVLAIALPILYGLLGWLITAVSCLIYNLAARFMGGIEFELTQTHVGGGDRQPAAS